MPRFIEAKGSIRGLLYTIPRLVFEMSYYKMLHV